MTVSDPTLKLPAEGVRGDRSLPLHSLASFCPSNIIDISHAVERANLATF